MTQDNQRIRAVIFDLDGTLLDTLADIATAANEVLAGRGFETHSLDQYRIFVGEGVSILFSRALPPAARTDETISDCVSLFREQYDQQWNVRTRHYTGVPELVASLRERRLPTAVLSNKPHEFTLRCVEHYFPAHSFDVVFGAREGVPRKPDPAGALEIAERLRVPVAGCAYVGDSSIDMRTALAAGMHPVGALWGFRSREEIVAGGAEVLLEQPLDFLKWLGSR
jgi:phosphoglycolate phosphatase